MSVPVEVIALAQAAAQAAWQKKATDVLGIDVSERMPLTEVFVLASAANERQVNAVVAGVEERLHGLGVKPVLREGRDGGRWVLVDFGDIVLHAFHVEDREFYDLERLWSDCPTVDLGAPPKEDEAQSAVVSGVEAAQGDGLRPWQRAVASLSAAEGTVEGSVGGEQ